MSPRTKEFVPEEALDSAMEVFWRQGYESTTMQELVDHMGINRFSIYDTFGDKHQLYLAATKRYQASQIAERVGAIDGTRSGLQAIRDHFDLTLKWLSTPEGRKGCLMINTIAENGLKDEEFRKQGESFLGRIEDAFHRALQRARKDGEIGTTKNLKDVARYLVGVLLGLNVMARGREGNRELRSVVRVALGTLE